MKLANALLLVGSLAVSSCQVTPRMEVDTTGLGSHELGRTLATTWMQSEADLTRNLRREIDKVQAANEECYESVSCLQQFGFDTCRTDHLLINCQYQGALVLTHIKSADESNRTKMKINVELKAAPERLVTLQVHRSGSSLIF